MDVHPCLIIFSLASGQSPNQLRRHQHPFPTMFQTRRDPPSMFDRASDDSQQYHQSRETQREELVEGDFTIVSTKLSYTNVPSILPSATVPTVVVVNNTSPQRADVPHFVLHTGHQASPNDELSIYPDDLSVSELIDLPSSPSSEQHSIVNSSPTNHGVARADPPVADRIPASDDPSTCPSNKASHPVFPERDDTLLFPVDSPLLNTNVTEDTLGTEPTMYETAFDLDGVQSYDQQQQQQRDDSDDEKPERAILSLDVGAMLPIPPTTTPTDTAVAVSTPRNDTAPPSGSVVTVTSSSPVSRYHPQRKFFMGCVGLLLFVITATILLVTTGFWNVTHRSYGDYSPGAVPKDVSSEESVIVSQISGDESMLFIEILQEQQQQHQEQNISWFLETSLFCDEDESFLSECDSEINVLANVDASTESSSGLEIQSTTTTTTSRTTTSGFDWFVMASRLAMLLPFISLLGHPRRTQPGYCTRAAAHDDESTSQQPHKTKSSSAAPSLPVSWNKYERLVLFLCYCQVNLKRNGRKGRKPSPTKDLSDWNVTRYDKLSLEDLHFIAECLPVGRCRSNMNKACLILAVTTSYEQLLLTFPKRELHELHKDVYNVSVPSGWKKADIVRHLIEIGF